VTGNEGHSSFAPTAERTPAQRADAGALPGFFTKGRRLCDEQGADAVFRGIYRASPLDRS
jgi:hypothetical protein